jgi:hypothetical protein
MDLTRSEKASALAVSLISALITLANLFGLVKAGVDEWQNPMFSAALFGYICWGMASGHRAAPAIFVAALAVCDGAILMSSHMAGSAALGMVLGMVFVGTFGIVSARAFFRVAKAKKNPPPVSGKIENDRAA